MSKTLRSTQTTKKKRFELHEIKKKKKKREREKERQKQFKTRIHNYGINFNRHHFSLCVDIVIVICGAREGREETQNGANGREDTHTHKLLFLPLQPAKNKKK